MSGEQEPAEDILASTKKPLKKPFNWNEELKFKKTDSGLFDNRGSAIKSSVVVAKKPASEMDAKTLVFMGVFLVVSFFLILNAMSPSRKF